MLQASLLQLPSVMQLVSLLDEPDLELLWMVSEWGQATRDAGSCTAPCTGTYLAACYELSTLATIFPSKARDDMLLRHAFLAGLSHTHTCTSTHTM